MSIKIKQFSWTLGAIMKWAPTLFPKTCFGRISQATGALNGHHFWPGFFKFGMNILFCNTLNSFVSQKSPLVLNLLFGSGLPPNLCYWGLKEYTWKTSLYYRWLICWAPRSPKARSKIQNYILSLLNLNIKLMQFGWIKFVGFKSINFRLHFLFTFLGIFHLAFTINLNFL